MPHGHATAAGKNRLTNVKGRWALITGASRGVGRQIALFMARQGCNLVLHSRSLQHTQDLLPLLREAGVEVLAFAAELGDITAVNQMLADIDATGIEIDIVYNNAAVQVAYHENYLQTPPQDFTTAFAINATAPAAICCHFLPGMLARGFGRIVNTTSGIRNQPELGAYSASKAALDRFTTDLASKLAGTGVMMNLVDPGWLRTDLGGPAAPAPVESSLPGMVLGTFLSDGISGRLFSAQDYTGLTLAQAVQKAGSISTL